MIITAELAQRIVDRIMPIVQQNVNIMNSSGMIIGSGQKDRINTCHKGAEDVAASGEELEIYPHDLERYPGTLPGLNWPIVLGTQTVGVVGVSGHPDTVRNTAKLVKMVTELILEREMLIDEFQSNMQLREQFVQLLLTGKSGENDAQLVKMANLLRFDLSLPRLVAVVDIKRMLEDACKQYGSFDLVISRTRESLKQLTEASPLIDSTDMVVFVENEFIILKHFPLTACSETYHQWGVRFIQMMENGSQYDSLSMGLGSQVQSPLELRYSYTEALFAQTMNAGKAKVAAIHDYNTLVSYLIGEPGAVETCMVFNNLKERISKKFECKYDMTNTIHTLLEHNLNISSAAKALFVHRNTLVFRLERLKELTGLCPGQFLNHAILCKMLFHSK
jgi:carbohydrate diacid regulator